MIVAPDAPEFSWAHPASEEAVLAIVAQVRKELSIDARRTLVTGFSMGGQGAWFFAATHPELFRAAIPMAAGPLTTRVSSRADLQAARAAMAKGDEWATPLLKTPLYVIHSRADQTVSVESVEEAVRTLEGRGARVTLSLIDDIPHNLVPGFIESLVGGPALGHQGLVGAGAGMTPDEFRKHGHAVVDWIADYRARVAASGR